MWEYLWRPWSIFAGTWAIACDFLYHLPFMTWYIQFAPIILTFTLAVVAVLLDEKSKNTKIGAGNKEDDAENNVKPDLKIKLFIPAYIIALVASMTAIYGPPESSVFDYTRMEFWIFIAVLTFSDVFKYWLYEEKDQKGGMRT